MSDTPTPTTVDQAHDIVARHLLGACVDRCRDVDNPGWEDYPEIGARDWTAVWARMESWHVNRPSQAQFDGAYAFLAARAGEVA